MDVLGETGIVDIEASGLHIEVHEWLIRPEPSWTYWDPIAEAMHGITRQHLFDEGQDARQVAEAINQLVGDGRGLLYSDAGFWDADWMQTLYTSLDITPRFHVISLFDLMSQRQAREFEKAFREIDASERYRRHRAGQDVRMLYEAYLAAVR